jgi:hypothetical protein
VGDQKPPDKTEFRSQESHLKVSETEMDLPTFPMLVRDWSRIRRRVSDLANPISWARDLAWSCVSLCAACLVALLPWLSAYDALGNPSRVAFAWITPALLAGAFGSAVVAAISFFLHSKVDSVVRRDVAHVLEEMDETGGMSEVDVAKFRAKRLEEQLQDAKRELQEQATRGRGKRTY